VVHPHQQRAASSANAAAFHDAGKTARYVAASVYATAAARWPKIFFQKTWRPCPEAPVMRPKRTEKHVSE